MEDIKFRYFGRTDISTGVGKVVIAYTGEHCGIAWCSPKEHYSKKLGKQIAVGRLLSKPISLPRINMGYGEWIDFLLCSDIAPGWLYKDI